MDFRGTYGISEQVSPMTNALLNDKIAEKTNKQKKASAGVIYTKLRNYYLVQK